MWNMPQLKNLFFWESEQQNVNEKGEGRGVEILEGVAREGGDTWMRTWGKEGLLHRHVTKDANRKEQEAEERPLWKQDSALCGEGKEKMKSEGHRESDESR